MNPFNFPSRPHDGQTHGVSMAAIRERDLMGKPMSDLMALIPDGWEWALSSYNGMRFIYANLSPE